MTDHTEHEWPWPGSRWWKFDFHTHTPASSDTYWAKTNAAFTEKDWLLGYMAAEVDCVAITDHNSGAWIDKLKNTYNQMKQQADDGEPPKGFRELTLFPGVEMSVQGGFHLLAIFAPESTTSDIDTLLGRVDYSGTKGSSDGVTREGAANVVQAVLDADGIPIPAHADCENGLLQVNPGKPSCALDPKTVHQVVDTEGLLAVEWLDRTTPLPKHVEKLAQRLTRVLGSDCHSFQGKAIPGVRHTWVKMSNPSLEGLRLALLDGNEISILRSDEETFEPFQTPAHFITGIKIDSARYMGNGVPESLDLTPYFNALIGGRGTGKSTIVQALRLAYRRDSELGRLGTNTEPYRRFKKFAESVKGREGDGALRENTEIRVEMMRDGVFQRLCWRQDGKGVVVEEQTENGEWSATDSQAVSAERFPIRLFSQGQIAAMAGESRQALLDVIDEAAGVADLNRSFEEAKRTYFSQRAKLREFDGKLDSRPELERKLKDLNRKIEALTQSHHADVLKAHQQAHRQRREVDTALEQLKEIPGRIETLANDLLLDDWPEGTFATPQDDDVLSWKSGAGWALADTRDELTSAAETLSKKVQELSADPKLMQWRQRADKAQVDHLVLQAYMADQGVADPQAFGRLSQERQELEGELKEFDQLLEKREHLETVNQIQWQQIITTRKAITQARTNFVETTLRANEFVQIEVVGFGFDARNIERSLRDRLDIQDERFESDILQFTGETPASGLAFELAEAEDKDASLQDVKQRLIACNEDLGGFFRNFLERQHNKPEFADHIRCWFPEDDLRIVYSRGGDDQEWLPIIQGSQGQRSAALLAFLLAFGDEPLVLDQPEDDLDNHLIYELIVRQIRENKQRRQLIIVTHNPNVVVNGDAEMVHTFAFIGGQCQVLERGALQEGAVRQEVCDIMEGGHEAFSRRWARLGEF